MRTIVEEKNGEDAVIDHGPHEIGHAMHKRLEIERGIQGISETVKKGNLQRLHSRVRFGNLFFLRAVVAFKRVLGLLAEAECGRGFRFGPGIHRQTGMILPLCGMSSVRRRL